MRTKKSETNEKKITTKSEVKTEGKRKRTSSSSGAKKSDGAAPIKDALSLDVIDGKERGEKLGRKPGKGYEDIWLSEEILLKRDACCMWLERVSTNDAGKQVMNRITGYYGKMSIVHLFESFAERRFRGIDASKPEEYLRKMKKVQEETYGLIKSLLAELEMRGITL